MRWKKSEVGIADIAIVGVAAYLAWRWWISGGPASIGVQNGGTMPVAVLTSDDLSKQYNFNTTRGGVVIETGSTSLRNGAPMVLAGPKNGLSTVPADAAARAAVAAYTTAKAAGTLPA